MGRLKRKKINLLPEEWNAKIIKLQEAKIEYKIVQSGINIHCKTVKHDYVASLTGVVDYEPNAILISKEFHKKTNYHYLEKDVTEEHNLYGYTVKKLPENKTKISWDFKTAGGYSEIKKEYAKEDLKVWAYDINSSFGYAMLQPMPNTNAEPKFDAEVGENEMGFSKHGFCTLNKGVKMDVVFPLMESPFKDYINEYYEIKKNAPKDSTERLEAKYKLNVPTGCIQRHNIFLRNAVLYYANRFIKQFIDENTVYCNIDSIYSLEPRNDLPIGNEIGQFKIEHENEYFKFLGRGIYQIGDKIHYQGLNGDLLQDIETTKFDKTKLNKYKYKFDKDKGRFILNETR